MKRIVILISLVLLFFALGCSGFSKIDHVRAYSRDGYSQPDKVIQSLDIQPGDHIADIGAGDGYFTFHLADAAGPSGRVYAVEVDEEKVEELKREVEDREYSNVSVILGNYDDPLLPDGTVDLVFLSDTYHHIEAREGYFSRLLADLTKGGRVAVIEAKPDVWGLWRLILPSGHSTDLEVLNRELEGAGYQHEGSFDFLPINNFEVLSVSDGR